MRLKQIRMQQNGHQPDPINLENDNQAWAVSYSISPKCPVTRNSEEINHCFSQINRNPTNDNPKTSFMEVVQSMCLSSPEDPISPGNANSEESLSDLEYNESSPLLGQDELTSDEESGLLAHRADFDAKFNHQRKKYRRGRRQRQSNTEEEESDDSMFSDSSCDMSDSKNSNNNCLTIEENEVLNNIHNSNELTNGPAIITSRQRNHNNKNIVITTTNKVTNLINNQAVNRNFYRGTSRVDQVFTETVQPLLNPVQMEVSSRLLPTTKIMFQNDKTEFPLTTYLDTTHEQKRIIQLSSPPSSAKSKILGKPLRLELKDPINKLYDEDNQKMDIAASSDEDNNLAQQDRYNNVSKEQNFSEEIFKTKDKDGVNLVETDVLYLNLSNLRDSKIINKEEGKTEELDYKSIIDTKDLFNSDSISQEVNTDDDNEEDSSSFDDISHLFPCDENTDKSSADMLELLGNFNHDVLPSPVRKEESIGILETTLCPQEIVHQNNLISQEVALMDSLRTENDNYEDDELYLRVESTYTSGNEFENRETMNDDSDILSEKFETECKVLTPDKEEKFVKLKETNRSSFDEEFEEDASYKEDFITVLDDNQTKYHLNENLLDQPEKTQSNRCGFDTNIGSWFSSQYAKVPKPSNFIKPTYYKKHFLTNNVNVKKKNSCSSNSIHRFVIDDNMKKTRAMKPHSLERNKTEYQQHSDPNGDFDVYNIETAMPTIDWEAMEEHLFRAAKENDWLLRRRNDREEIRRKLAMDSDSEDYYCGEPVTRKPSLSTRLQSGMNLQICFMNETASDLDSQGSDHDSENGNSVTASFPDDSNISPMREEEDIRNHLDIKESKAQEQRDHKTFYSTRNVFPSTQSEQSLQEAAKRQRPSFFFSRQKSWRLGQPSSFIKKDEPTLKKSASTQEDFLTRHARLQAEARLALSQAKDMARMQMEVERQKKKKSPIADIVGMPFPESHQRLTKPVLNEMNVAQLQVIVNDLHTQIESLNEDLVRLLLERDDLNMEQDSMLVDIEDMTRFLGAKDDCLKLK